MRPPALPGMLVRARGRAGQERAAQAPRLLEDHRAITAERWSTIQDAREASIVSPSCGRYTNARLYKSRRALLAVDIGGPAWSRKSSASYPSPTRPPRRRER